MAHHPTSLRGMADAQVQHHRCFSNRARSDIPCRLEVGTSAAAIIKTLPQFIDVKPPVERFDCKNFPVLMGHLGDIPVYADFGRLANHWRVMPDYVTDGEIDTQRAAEYPEGHPLGTPSAKPMATIGELVGKLSIPD